MRLQRRWPLLLLLCICILRNVAWFVSASREKSNEVSDDDESDADSNDDDSDGDVLQKNPQYEKAPNDSGDEDERDGKTAIATALKSKSGIRRKSTVFLKKHRFKITVALAVFAFRKEIKELVWLTITKPVHDPKTGEIVRRPVGLSPTSIIKIVLFIDLMRRLQSSGDGKSSPMLALMLAGGRGNPALAMFLAKLLSPANSAFLPPVEQHYTFEKVNERYARDSLALQKVINPPEGGNLPPKNIKRATISKLFRDRPTQTYNETVILVDWTGLDSSISQMSVLRDQISFVLHEFEKQKKAATEENATSPLGEAEVEVVILLESPGGSAADYALASEQILRMRKGGIKVTMCVDKVAASGGYMIACTSSPGRLFAAPFAILGSIGVIGQSLNIQKTLKGWGVEPLVFRGGKAKAPVGLIGDITEDGVAIVQDMIDSTHRAFKKHVVTARPLLANRIEELATGDIWLGYDAVENGLVDRLVTSDEYIGERLSQGACILKLVQLVKPRYPFSRPTTATFSSIGATAKVYSVLSLLLSTFFNFLIDVSRF